MATDYKKIANEIVNVVGKENITSITHCATRLRLEVNDRSM
ncbi:MAG: PTS transporter subunit EIIB, partial [Tetragenococcus koreensis]|nr:PTS transporter subunit EIIB [Tetragenococcus koreensis]MDN6497887.1 PTS transporter subunit EIIB [Tetragenococcus koreensis]